MSRQHGEKMVLGELVCKFRVVSGYDVQKFLLFLFGWQVNQEERTVTVEAGIQLTELNEKLYQNGLAFSV